MFRTFKVLHDAMQGHAVFRRAWEEVKPYLLAGNTFELVIRPETRTSDQNDKFHAICTNLAKSELTWAGKKRNATQWKVLLISGHAVATREEVEVVPGLEGEFLNIRESTALMSKRRGSSLIEYAVAFCDQNGIKTDYAKKR